jgi:hypothetical protein
MAPDAYTLEAAFEGWNKSESTEQLKLLAAEAYSKYQ